MATHRVLIVDDQHDVRRVLASGIRTLSRAIEVVEIPSGEEALLDVARRPVDLVVTDVRLPGLNGFELVTRLKKRHPNAKVILVTGLDDPKIRRQVSDAGADAFFYKPVHMADFLDAVERCLGLVETIFTPLPVAPDPGSETQPATPAELIADLRHTLNAIAVIMIDIVGQVEARAGDLPGDVVEHEWLPVILSALAASARLTHTLKTAKPRGFFYLESDTFNLCVAHLGKSHAAIVVTCEPMLPAHFEAIENFAARLDLDIKAIELPVEEMEEAETTAALPALEELPLEELPVEELPALDALFAQTAQVAGQDLDTFWDSVSDQGSLDGVFTAKTLTYEQAIKLGLAPGEEEEKPK